MTINERIRAAVTPVIPDCVPGEYTGDNESYCTFDVIEMGELFAEGTAQVVVATVILHWYRPKNTNPNAVIAQLVRGMVAQGGTYATITHGAEETMLEFELDGDPVGTV